MAPSSNTNPLAGLVAQPGHPSPHSPLVGHPTEYVERINRVAEGNSAAALEDALFAHPKMRAAAPTPAAPPVIGTAPAEEPAEEPEDQPEDEPVLQSAPVPEPLPEPTPEPLPEPTPVVETPVVEEPAAPASPEPTGIAG